MTTECSRQDDPQLTFWKIGKQQVTVDFNGGRIVSDAGLLPIREFEQKLGIIKGLTERFPDPRNPLLVVHTAEKILAQNVYQFLAGYFDSNDAQALRDDPLFQMLVGTSPDQEDGELASGSTLSRFQYSYTRRQCRRAPEERPAFFEQRQSQLDRVQVLNEYFVDLFIGTRRQRPAHVIIDLDATDDPTHGQQVLSFYHGYYRQKQYFPLLVFDGETGFPLAASRYGARLVRRCRYARRNHPAATPGVAGRGDFHPWRRWLRRAGNVRFLRTRRPVLHLRLLD